MTMRAVFGTTCLMSKKPVFKCDHSQKKGAQFGTLKYITEARVFT